MKSFLLENYLAFPEKYDQQSQSCLICFQPLTTPVECNKCNSKYCLKCANKWNSKHQTCPMKCSNPWEYRKIQSLKILLYCPFNNKCSYILLEDFQQHIRICKYSTLPKKYQKLKKLNMCLFQHYLEFQQNSKLAVDQICASCEEDQICRSICRICQFNQLPYAFCQKCRPNRHSKTYCPLKHKFYIRFDQLSKTICDHCGSRMINKGKKYYDDRKCDYAICQQCMQKVVSEQDFTLPEDMKICKYFYELEGIKKKCQQRIYSK